MKTKINEIDFDNQQIENDMEAVMTQRVAKSTRESKKRSNTTLILWIFFSNIVDTPVFYNLRSTI